MVDDAAESLGIFIDLLPEKVGVEVGPTLHGLKNTTIWLLA